jgi:hypothetical protein
MTRFRAAALALAWLCVIVVAWANEPGTAGAPPEVLHVPLLERHVEQGILRPVPISVTLPSDVALRARRVLVHYRLWGEPDWTTLEMRRTEKAFEGAVPCMEVSTVTGDLKYYIRVHDADGRVIATGASLAKPYRVTIKHDSTLAPGQARVERCPDPTDCPVGLLGCPSERVVDIPCQSDRDCEHGMTCSWRGFCERTDRRTNWVSVAVEQDFGLVQTSGACGIYSQENEGYACYRADGEQYNGTAIATNEPLGFGLGPTRLVAGYERLVFYDTSIGLRVGWAVRGEGPTPRGGTPFVPVSASARVTHWFGHDPLARSGFRPFAFVTGGYMMVDVSTSTRIREDPTARPFQGENDLEQTVDLWKRAGDAFVGAGLGLSFAFTTGTAIFIDTSTIHTFPFGAFVIAPSAGVMLGF